MHLIQSVSPTSIFDMTREPRLPCLPLLLNEVLETLYFELIRGMLVKVMLFFKWTHCISGVIGPRAAQLKEAVSVSMETTVD